MSTITFTCPHCQSQTNFSSTAVGQQGKCSGCLQNVTIQPNLPPPLPNPAAKNKIIIIATVGCGALVVLGLALLSIPLLILSVNKDARDDGILTEQPFESRNEPANESQNEGPAAPRDQSSPEALGRSVFEVVKSDDMEAFITMLPDEELMEEFITTFSKTEMFTEREAEQFEKEARRTDFSEEALKIRNKSIDRFNSLVKYRDWQDADIVTVVSAGRRRLGEVSMTEYTFVVVELETELHVLMVRNSIEINGNWYFNFDGAQITVGLLSEMSTTRARVLLDALERTKDSNRNRILREVPR